MEKLGAIIYLIFAICVSMVGYHMHNSAIWAIIDFCFSPLVFVKWLFCHEISLTVIKETFKFLLQ